MKSLISTAFVALLFSCCVFSVNASEKREFIEQWRIYTHSETNPTRLAAVLYSFDGEDAALGIRCEKRQPELYFMLSDSLPVQMNSVFIMKADGIELESGKWKRASGGNGAFAFKPASLINQLADKKSLILTYKTAQGKYKVAGFYLAGLDQLSEKLESVCQVNMAE